MDLVPVAGIRPGNAGIPAAPGIVGTIAQGRPQRMNCCLLDPAVENRIKGPIVTDLPACEAAQVKVRSDT
jgi:hypothetical protein